MEQVFQNVLTASFHGSIVILAVLLLRLALKKTPKKYVCLLWLLAGIRLLMPFEIRSDLSLQPQMERIPYVAEVQEQRQAATVLPRPQPSETPAEPVSTEISRNPEWVPRENYWEYQEEETQQSPPVQTETNWMELFPWFWLAVACGFGVYTVFSYATLKLRVRDAVKIPGGWESERIETAFILGFFRPKIYIPMGMPVSVRRHILAHERTHLEKGDHWFKMIGFVALAIHWFNPLVWVAYILLCKDIEMACDEQVIRFMELEERKQYSAALLTCSANRAHFAACPIAFGEVSVKERVMSVLNYKKPGFWISLLGIVAIVFVAVCLVTSPGEEPVAPPPETAETVEPVTTVTVKNPDELLAAIAPNTEILLEPGDYILSEADSYGKSVNEYCLWEERFDGYQLTISGVENLTIRGSGIHVTVVETDPRYANVIGLEHCSNVVLEDFTAGHTRDRGECGGGVIDLTACQNVTMNRLGIFGCGVVGVYAEGCEGVTVNDCDIYDCSSAAASLFNSRDVVVYGCRIYDIGDEVYGGYTFFDIQDCKGVFIENNQFSNSNLNHFVSAVLSNVLLKNNLFENNRPQGCAFTGTEHGITMDGNRFEGNNIRNWYSLVEAAKDTDGKPLTEEKLNELYGIEPEVPTQPRLEIHVSTVDELIAAIGPNTEIVLDAAEYDLSTATGYGTSSGEYYYWEDIFDGPGLVITNVSNMTIRSNDGKFTEHTICAVPRYADVLLFRGCTDITVSGFTAGHTQAPGSCAGGVLEFHDCDRITVDNCGLFGCGILGVQADNCSNVIVQNSSIYECSEGGIRMHNVDGVVVEGTSFRDIGGRNTIYLASCKNVMVDGNMVLMSEYGLYEATTPEQEKTIGLERVVNDFANSYLHNDREYMQIYLAEGYEPEVWVTEFAFSNLFWAEITYDHVLELERAGKMIFEVPFKEWNGEWVDEYDTRYLLVTVIEEDGIFKVSDCREK